MQDKPIAPIVPLECSFRPSNISLERIKPTENCSYVLHFGYFGCLLRIKADQVDSSCIFLGGVREIYESSSLLVPPVKDPPTLINYKEACY